jgi:hypothetical protein
MKNNQVREAQSKEAQCTLRRGTCAFDFGFVRRFKAHGMTVALAASLLAYSTISQ